MHYISSMDGLVKYDTPLNNNHIQLKSVERLAFYVPGTNLLLPYQRAGIMYP